jgi:hypothetical protein
MNEQTLITGKMELHCTIDDYLWIRQRYDRLAYDKEISERMRLWQIRYGLDNILDEEFFHEMKVRFPIVERFVELQLHVVQENLICMRCGAKCVQQKEINGIMCIKTESEIVNDAKELLHKETPIRIEISKYQERFIVRKGIEPFAIPDEDLSDNPVNLSSIYSGNYHEVEVFLHGLRLGYQWEAYTK